MLTLAIPSTGQRVGFSFPPLDDFLFHLSLFYFFTADPIECLRVSLDLLLFSCALFVFSDSSSVFLICMQVVESLVTYLEATCMKVYVLLSSFLKIICLYFSLALDPWVLL